MFAGFVLFCIAVPVIAHLNVGPVWGERRRPHPRARHEERK